jgi:uncharacterized protein with von Willebrand factor type A (vWA) domain
MAIDTVLHEFVSTARRAGLLLSPVEAIDVERAAMAIGLARRDDLKSALRAVMVKDLEQRGIFDRAFDAFFAADGRAQGNLHDRLRSRGFSDAELGALDDLLDALGAQSAQGGGTGLAVIVAGGGALEQLLAVAGRGAQLERIQSAMQVGFYTMRVLDGLGVPRAQTELGALRERLRDALGARGDALADAIAAELERARQLAREYVQGELARRTTTQLDDLRQARLEERSFAVLDRTEVARVMVEVERLAERLKGRLAVRRRRERRGQLDLRRTIRASFRTGALPFRPVFRRRRRDRPKLVLLCDVSDSVRTAARFLLVFVHAVQEVFARTRSFVFVSDLGETTELFATHEPERAVALAYGGSVISVASNSNYGAAFAQFLARYRDALDARTTVVVLGDGRNNYNDPNTPALREIRRRAGRVLWLNPEPPGAWGFGDSAMKLYEPLCDEAHPVHDLASLRVAVDRLVRR